MLDLGLAKGEKREGRKKEKVRENLQMSENDCLSSSIEYDSKVCERDFLLEQKLSRNRGREREKKENFQAGDTDDDKPTLSMSELPQQ